MGPGLPLDRSPKKYIAGAQKGIESRGGAVKIFLVLPIAFTFTLYGQESKPITGYVGMGLTPPISGFGSRHDTGGNFLAGIGYRFNRTFGVNFEYTFNELDYIFPETPLGQRAETVLHGHTRLHGFTLAPRITLPSIRLVNTYVTAGYGIYDRSFQVTTPGLTTGIVCDPWWGFCTGGLVPVDVVVAEHSTWKQGYNVGLGVEFGRNVKFFADVRYLWIATRDVRVSTFPVAFGVHF